MNAIGEYQAALRSYQTSRASAAEMFKFITTAADSIAHKQVAFLAHFFGVSAPADEVMNVRNEAKNHRYDITKWPSYEDMKTTIESWHLSFNALNNAWHKIPQDEKVGLMHPPKVMQTT
jgi:hypothetical protein